MLDKDEASSWPQHAVDLLECLAYGGGTAQRPGAHHRVKRMIGEGEVLAVPDQRIDPDRRCGDPFLGHGKHAWIGIKRRNPGDMGWVVGEVQPGPEADFEHLP